jgi:hypothetical protein
MGVLFSGPLVYKQMTDRVRAASRAHAKAFKQVSDMRERVKLILAYTDRTYSPLELLRIVSERLPQGITLTGFNFPARRRRQSHRRSGFAHAGLRLQKRDDEDPLFESVSLTGPSAIRGKHKFDVDAKCKGVPQK